MLTRFEEVLQRLEIDSRNGDKAKAFCPAHDDRNSPSLSVKAVDGKVLLHCFVGCKSESILAAVGLEMKDLFEDRDKETPPDTPPNELPLVPSLLCLNGNEISGCTLAAYAEAKGLPVEFLRGSGVRDCKYGGAPAVRIPYPDAGGQEVAVRFRISLDGDDKFRWRSGDKPVLYGLPLLNRTEQAGYVVLVEGESDAHTLWHHEVPAVGVPGANNWRNNWTEALEGVEKIYVVVEPDQGGETFWRVLAASDLRERLYRVELDEAKDVSELHLRGPAMFGKRFESALRRATAWLDIAESEAAEKEREAWAKCEDLALDPDILRRFAEELKRAGVAGESRTAKVLYLAVTSRLLTRPVSVAVKGPSSGGKSYLTERVLDHFPQSAYYAITSMSEHALVYGDEPLVHRFLVIYEASGMEGDLQTYFIRSLLSEGCIRYETVEKTDDGLKARLVEREGPTGLLVTTTAVKLHPENETRLISLTVADTRDQTRDIMAALAEEAVEETDLGPWHALQEWLEAAEHRATVPYAKHLAALVPPVAVRLRRDFGAVLVLIRAHAILHQATRERDEEGRVVATIEDYSVVRELIVDLVSEGVDATVKPVVRETVETVARLLEDDDSVTIKALGQELELEQTTVSRRARMALEAGYLKNLEDRKGKPIRLVLGDDMPEDLKILPTVEELEMAYGDTSVPVKHSKLGTKGRETEGVKGGVSFENDWGSV